MKVMGHCHLFPGGFGQEKRDEFGVPGTAEHLLRFARACGFDRAQALAPHEPSGAVATAVRAGDSRDNLDWLLDQPGVGTDDAAAIIPAATIAPDRPDAVAGLRHAMARGVRWLKIHPLIGRTNTLDPACDAFYGLAAEARMPVVYHTGSSGWGSPGQCAHPDACARIAGRFPQLPMLMAHCGFFGDLDAFDIAVGHCRTHRNLYLDATHALLRVGRDRWTPAIDRVGAGRVVYGNDYPWCSIQQVQEELELIGSLGLDADDTERLLGGNLMELHAAAAPRRG